MLPASVRPTSLAGIKRLAKSLKLSQAITHLQALDTAARNAGYQCYQHARKVLVQLEVRSGANHAARNRSTPVGNGEWPSQWGTKPEQGLLIGTELDTGSAIILPDTAALSFVSIEGRLGAGKYSLKMALLYQQMLRGGGGLLITHSDSEFSAVQALATKAGREHDLVVIAPWAASHPQTYSPLFSGTGHQIATRVLELLPHDDANFGLGIPPAATGAEYYRVSIYRAIKAMIDAHHSANIPYTISELIARLVNKQQRQEFTTQLETRIGATPSLNQFKAVFDPQADADGTQYAADESRLSSVLNGIAGRLFMMATGDCGALMNSHEPALQMPSMIAHSKIVVVQISIMEKCSHQIQLLRVIMADFVDALQNGAQSARQNLIPFHLWVEEPQSFGSRRFHDLLANAGYGKLACFAVVNGASSAAQAMLQFNLDMPDSCTTQLVFKTGTAALREAASARFRQHDHRLGLDHGPLQIDDKDYGAMLDGLNLGECLVAQPGQRVQAVRVSHA